MALQAKVLVGEPAHLSPPHPSWLLKGPVLCPLTSTGYSGPHTIIIKKANSGFLRVFKKWQDNLGCGSEAPASLGAPLRKMLNNA